MIDTGRYDHRKIKRRVLEDFKKRFDEARTAEEMGIIRDEFFNLPYGEERLENGWDIVCGCADETTYEYIPQPHKDKYTIPMEEIIRLFNKGYRVSTIAKKYNISTGTLKYRIQRYMKMGV